VQTAMHILTAAKAEAVVARKVAYAREELQAAMRSMSMEVLLPALQKAKDEGVEAEIIGQATVVLNAARVEQAKIDAKEALFLAIEQSSVASLQSAIAKAKAVGVDESVLITASNAVAVAEAKAAATDCLQFALEKNSLVALESAIEKARARGVELKLIIQADEAVQGLYMAQAKEAATFELRNAMKDGDINILDAAIQKATAGNVDAAILDQAHSALNMARDIFNATSCLKAAISQKSLNSLSPAIDVARNLGVDAALLSEAEHALTSCKQAKATLNRRL